MAAIETLSAAQLRFLDRWIAAREAAIASDVDPAAFVAGRRALAKRLLIPPARKLICPNLCVPWPLLNNPPKEIEIVSDQAGLAATFYNMYYRAPDLMERMISRTAPLFKRGVPSLEEIAGAMGWPDPPEPLFLANLWFALSMAAIARRPSFPEKACELEKGRERRFVALHRRLAAVSFEAKDLADLIELYDSEDTLFLIDQRSFSYDLKREETLMLRRMLPSLKGRAIVLIYDRETAKDFENATEISWSEPTPGASRWLPRFVARNYRA